MTLYSEQDTEQIATYYCEVINRLDNLEIHLEVISEVPQGADISMAILRENREIYKEFKARFNALPEHIREFPLLKKAKQDLEDKIALIRQE